MPNEKESSTSQSSPSRPQRSGNKHLAENLTKDELLKRLKKIAQKLSDAEQGENLEDYHGTVTVLAKPFILRHSDKDIRFYAACCLANVFRIYAPNAPYDEKQLWTIFNLIITQLEGLKNAKTKGEKGISYEKLFNLLETISKVKIFILCVEMQFTDLITKCFTVFFKNVRDEHSNKVKNFMLDILSSIIAESVTLPPGLIDTILENIVSPNKLTNHAAYELACSLIERSSSSLEPHILLFFNNSLFFDKASESSLEDVIYDIIFELYKVCPSILLSVLPQLDCKIKSLEKNDRIQVVALLGKMFSDKDSNLAQSHKLLWHSFLNRFVDIETDVRVEVTQHIKCILVNHPELTSDITEKLLHRHRDPEQRVRLEVVYAICEAASVDVNNIPDELYEVLVERLRDRKFEVRKETMMALGRLYKKISSGDISESDAKKMSWIPTKILHCYYNNLAEDRIHVERVFLGCLVPISLPKKERMRRLFDSYLTLDDNAIRSFNHMFKTQASLRSDMNDVLRLWEEHENINTEHTRKLLTEKITGIAAILPEPGKSLQHLKSLVKKFTDKKLFESLKTCFETGQDCSKVTEAVKEVVVKFGAKNPLYDTIKVILDRAAPLLIDKSCAKELVTLATDTVNIDSQDDEDLDSDSSIGNDVTEGKKFDLLMTCVTYFPAAFKFPLIFENLLIYLKKNDFYVGFALRIFVLIGKDIEEIDSTLSSHFQQALLKIFTKGKPSQVKLTARIIAKTFSNASNIFQRIMENCVEKLKFESTSIISTLYCISEIALHAPEIFEPYHTAVVRDFVLKELLLKDRGNVVKRGALWCKKEDLSKEGKAKIQGLKIIVNWLRGEADANQERVQPVVAMLNKAIKLAGDINDSQRIRPCEMSHIRLTAACGLLKLACVSAYHEYLDMKSLQLLTTIVTDKCTDVRQTFATKLSKGLDSFSLPLEYLALFSFYGRDSTALKQRTKQMLLRNIQLRNEWLRRQKTTPEGSISVLPEYAMPYLIYLLSHLPNHDYTKSDELNSVKDFLWFFMESILARGDNYNFLRKLAENIKQTKDANDETENSSKAIYVVCDIVIGIIVGLSKTQTSMPKDFMGNIVLPKKLFARLNKKQRNDQSYLPKSFVLPPMKKTGNVVPKITPSKNGVKSTSSTNKKITSPQKSKRVLDPKPKTKKIQKSLLSMMEKKVANDGNTDTSEDDTSPRGEISKDISYEDEDDDDDEETYTKLSPRKKMKISNDDGKDSRRPNSSRNDEARKKRGKQSPTKVMKEERPTRFSPRGKGKSTTKSDEMSTDSQEHEDHPDRNSKIPIDKRSKDSFAVDNDKMHGKSLDAVLMESNTHKSVQRHTKNIKIGRSNGEEEPMEQSSLFIKRKRKAR
ncbi:sister chromatid cohesion protein PDS5 homolog B-like [Xenia sp. Carnegie-2017]|uniref:sister chromatid cohesion protein PDS5 homolog B-like n=1 Tax=Xenia sp. Carnegie-2017 TaxID=2897299 RepID=UPI001F04E98A|nr:sister chromatid cohesion protein PDS5 homolog B-like [Xenia sp. Carnegie-2017]